MKHVAFMCSGWICARLADLNRLVTVHDERTAAALRVEAVRLYLLFNSVNKNRGKANVYGLEFVILYNKAYRMVENHF